jgi:hypothetical protein
MWRLLKELMAAVQWEIFMINMVMKRAVLWDVTPCIRRMSVDNSEEHTASIFRVQQWANRETSKILLHKFTFPLFGSLFNHAGECRGFPKNPCALLPDYKPLPSWRQYSSYSRLWEPAIQQGYDLSSSITRTFLTSSINLPACSKVPQPTMIPRAAGSTFTRIFQFDTSHMTFQNSNSNVRADIHNRNPCQGS